MEIRGYLVDLPHYRVEGQLELQWVKRDKCCNVLLSKLFPSGSCGQWKPATPQFVRYFRRKERVLKFACDQRPKQNRNVRILGRFSLRTRASSGRTISGSPNSPDLRPSPHPQPDGPDHRHRHPSRPPFRTRRPVEPNPFDSVTEKLADVDLSTGIDFDAYDDIPVEMSGVDAPPPMEGAFCDIDLGCSSLNGNVRRCGYVKPTPVQRYAMPVLMAGRDLMACAQTGSGKTAAFCFPIIARIVNGPGPRRPRRGGSRMACPSALILSPTRELSAQIHEEAKKFAFQTGVKVVVAYGGAPIHLQLRELERGVDILVATPGRLVDLIERARISLHLINFLALDEADRMLDMGFEPQIRKIVQQMDMPPPGIRQTMLFSATFPTEIQRMASDFLSNYIFLAVGKVGSSTGLIAQKVEFVNDFDKRSHLMNLLRTQKVNGTHGKEREYALRNFKTGTTPIMVATDVAARGLDIPHVAHVINFDLPKAIDDYVHRIGRTGRAGKSGLATALFSEVNVPLAKALVDLMQEANQEVPSWLSQYAEESSYGVSNGRNHRFGGNRFGGRDFRKGAPPRKGGLWPGGKEQGRD
ncbi:DEAD-box ATP-dependent RNA helicase 52 [Acorus calamus]|uniref:RNA helicase n=1 Tax=Acorus calamus TaxID=4465 RepID=A0AAV9E0E6_ACOCL|nr:DEAD-box ATP-dependent RNA helicase 52 [Acorus calamus]